MTGRVPQRARGIALIAALLTLAAIATLAAATFVLLRLDIALAENRQDLALARADARSQLTLALLRLEAASRDGVLPDGAPAVPGLVSYRRFDDRSASLAVEGGADSGKQLREASIELRQMGGQWRVLILESR